MLFISHTVIRYNEYNTRITTFYPQYFLKTLIQIQPLSTATIDFTEYAHKCDIPAVLNGTQRRLDSNPGPTDLMHKILNYCVLDRSATMPSLFIWDIVSQPYEILGELKCWEENKSSFVKFKSLLLLDHLATMCFTKWAPTKQTSGIILLIYFLVTVPTATQMDENKPALN
jgi:hypothetical protein